MRGIPRPGKYDEIHYRQNVITPLTACGINIVNIKGRHTTTTASRLVRGCAKCIAAAMSRKMPPMEIQ